MFHNTSISRRYVVKKLMDLFIQQLVHPFVCCLCRLWKSTIVHLVVTLSGKLWKSKIVHPVKLTSRAADLQSATVHYPAQSFPDHVSINFAAPTPSSDAVDGCSNDCISIASCILVPEKSLLGLNNYGAFSSDSEDELEITHIVKADVHTIHMYDG